ncbi:sugar kinase [Parahaliea mediterranea]|uniref:Sugar kinase n=1 Tax=Parahaliea mediterranea TaxID=651086 RepID=A0A939DC26_9GAMM|nr:sugar kinase [Parahaliea mediterranea]MBN7795279.1 sugar kinase [Parahaliea mediterranea]
MALSTARDRAARVCCIGEVMLEFAPCGGARDYRLAYGGDTYNTAVYLARKGVAVEYLTALGDDAFSDEILAELRREGVRCDNVHRSVGQQPGLYVISNDADGERAFHYWRDSSPVRALFDGPMAPPRCEVVYFSGITLAVIRRGLDHFLAMLDTLRGRGAAIVMDCNYRARQWASNAEAREIYRQVLPRCDLLFSGVDDECALWGDGEVEASHARYRAAGISEVLVRDSALVTHLFTGGDYLSVRAERTSPVDTTGAGDAFNAACLAGRLQGLDWRAAIVAAQHLAARVVQARGAVIAPSAMD